jgi:hypothetical protein
VLPREYVRRDRLLDARRGVVLHARGRIGYTVARGSEIARASAARNLLRAASKIQALNQVEFK